jgi:hydrophobic/amphiphilic exporter-1 (mainly G- bacteria), HAE1 family
LPSFPGTTGILFRQFALTIAFSIAISAFNALTLAPVLAAIFLSGPTGKSGGGCKNLTTASLS